MECTRSFSEFTCLLSQWGLLLGSAISQQPAAFKCRQGFPADLHLSGKSLFFLFHPLPFLKALNLHCCHICLESQFISRQFHFTCNLKVFLEHSGGNLTSFESVQENVCHTVSCFSLFVFHLFSSATTCGECPGAVRCHLVSQQNPLAMTYLNNTLCTPALGKPANREGGEEGLGGCDGLLTTVSDNFSNRPPTKSAASVHNAEGSQPTATQWYRNTVCRWSWNI